MNELQEKATTYDLNPELIERYRDGDELAGQRLVEINLPLVYSIAARFKERCDDMGDLVECGTIGLVKAFKTFDLSRGCAFSTYAVPLIFGEIRRTLRDEGIIKVGRSYKTLGVQLMRAKNELMMKYGEEVHISLIASTVGVSVEEAAIALDAMSTPISLSDFAYGEEDGTLIEDTVADLDSLEYNRKFFERMALREAISKLNEDRQKILILRFFRNKTQQQVADILGLTQVKVSREEKKIVEFLRNELKC